jgi:hypothetical protein
MTEILKSLALRITIDPTFFAPYLFVLGTIGIEFARRALPLRPRQRRWLALILYPLLIFLIVGLFLALGSPLKYQLEDVEIKHAFEVDFGAQMRLLGYSIANQVSPNSDIQLTLYWYALRDIQVDYSIFVHLMSADGTIVAQDDHYPVANTHPTRHWLRGELVQDSSQLQLPPDAPAGEYKIVIGVYQWQTGERLPAYVDGHRVQDDAIVLPTTVMIASD